MNMKKILPLVTFAVLVLAPYATQGQFASGPQHIDYKEASAFELALLARESNAPKQPEKLYIQPTNKAEACRLPTTIARPLDGPRFRDYWDGECKNGFAFGLGRDIAISDTYHVEEITILDGTGDDRSQPSVYYDYVDNMVAYTVRGTGFPEATSLSETMVNSVSGFNAYQTLTVVDDLGKILTVQSSSFQPQRIFVNTRTDGAITYKFTDNTAAPVTNQNAPVFATEIVDPKSNTVGLAVVRYANGAVQHFKVSDGKNEVVSLPAAYTDHLQTKYQEVVNVTSRASANLQRAQQIEREYLYKACNGKSSIKGLDNSDYTKICTWRDQFKEPYAIASGNYQRQLESLRQQATTAEQQRQIQQLIAQQQQMLQQQRNQQAWNQANQANQRLQQQTQQLLNQANQTSQQLQQRAQQGVNSWQVPQVQPITPPNGNTVICHTIGSITTCR